MAYHNILRFFALIIWGFSALSQFTFPTQPVTFYGGVQYPISWNGNDGQISLLIHNNTWNKTLVDKENTLTMYLYVPEQHPEQSSGDYTFQLVTNDNNFESVIITIADKIKVNSPSYGISWNAGQTILLDITMDGISYIRGNCNYYAIWMLKEKNSNGNWKLIHSDSITVDNKITDAYSPQDPYPTLDSNTEQGSYYLMIEQFFPSKTRTTTKNDVKVTECIPGRNVKILTKIEVSSNNSTVGKHNISLTEAYAKPLPRLRPECPSDICDMIKRAATCNKTCVTFFFMSGAFFLIGVVASVVGGYWFRENDPECSFQKNTCGSVWIMIILFGSWTLFGLMMVLLYVAS